MFTFNSQIGVLDEKYGIRYFHVIEVDFEAVYYGGFETRYLGAVRLYDIENLKGSQVDMLVETFDNSMEVDEDFVAEVDEECKIEENWPFCTAGKYMIDPDIDCYIIGTCPWVNCRGFDWMYTYNLCTDPAINFWRSGAPQYDDEEELLSTFKLSHGMNNRYVEPWFACSVTQRFNDGLTGYIHGQQTTYNLYNGALLSRIKVTELELDGKYTEECYFQASWSQLVSQHTEQG